MQVGLSLSSAVRSDFPPSGRSGESSAHKAFRFALSVAVPVRLLRFRGRAAGLEEPLDVAVAGLDTGTGAEVDEVEGEV